MCHNHKVTRDTLFYFFKIKKKFKKFKEKLKFHQMTGDGVNVT